jgi:hypothetical protein
MAPETITLDGYAASHRAVREMMNDELLIEDTTLRSSKYLNNLIDQDHRHIKSRVNVMLSFKRFRNATVTISGIELMHRIRKAQFDLTNLRLKEITAPSVWMTVLSARWDGGQNDSFSLAFSICTATRPGLHASSISAVAYCFHCSEMSPAFWSIWYLLGMMFPAALEAVLGPELLRWWPVPW